MRMGAYVVLLGCLAFPALGQSNLKAPTIILLEGTCDRFQALAVDATPYCLGRMTRDIITGGRRAFTFYADGKGKASMILSFMSVSSVPINQGGDVFVQSVDGIIMTIGHEKPTVGRAVGACHFNASHDRTAFVACAAEVSEGHFEARFSPSGASPSILRPAQ